MSTGKYFKRFVQISLSVVLIACATSPLGRKQFIIVPEGQMNEMGTQAFQQLKTTEPMDSNPKMASYMRCIIDPLLQAAQGQTSIDHWEVVVFRSKDANAFALPGGKIGVYTGLLEVAKTDAQLAAVLGHEIGHVIARHGAERVSQQAGTQMGLATLGAVTPDNPNKKLLMNLLGVGAQVGILLPFSRTQESEADLIGLDLMARAGFDPRSSVLLWENMTAASGGKAPPQWLSTHPASENRISALQEHMHEALPKFEQARRDGLSPQCVRP